MSEMTSFQELATWVGGIGASAAALAVSFSKIARGYSADRQAVSNDSATSNLYERLLKENGRIDERNKSLELKNDAMMVRLANLEVVHIKLQAVEAHNKSLKESIVRKDAQLTVMIRQQRTDRDNWALKFKEQDRVNANLTRQLETIQSTLLQNASDVTNTSRRITDAPEAEVPTIVDENNV